MIMNLSMEVTREEVVVVPLSLLLAISCSCDNNLVVEIATLYKC